MEIFGENIFFLPPRTMFVSFTPREKVFVLTSWTMFVSFIVGEAPKVYFGPPARINSASGGSTPKV
jgi:hypothetical protein